MSANKCWQDLVNEMEYPYHKCIFISFNVGKNKGKKKKEKQ